jgi:hypothetical protein
MCERLFSFLVRVESEYSSAKDEAEANTASVKSTYINLNPLEHGGKYKIPLLKTLHFVHTKYLYVLFDSYNKQQLFP